jgi:FkbM family methyltransferase
MQAFRSPRRVARRFRHLPAIIRGVRTWQRFMINYALGMVPQREYVLRNGARLLLARAVEHVPVIEVFLREEYGQVADGAFVVDIGASTGVFSVYALTSAPQVSLLAYEPFPESYQLLVANIAANGCEARAQCRNLAVAGEPGRRALHVRGTAFHFPTLLHAAREPDGTSLEVACASLEEICRECARPIDLLKMDCEGSEYEILYRAPERCLTGIREIRMEYHTFAEPGHDPLSLARHLVDHEFRISLLQPTSSANGILWATREPPGPHSRPLRSAER